MERVRFGIIGAAGVIGLAHIKAILAAPEAELVGITDINQERNRALAEEYGVRAYREASELLQDPSIEAVTLAVPHPLHVALALEAFDAGKHVLTEKPIAVSVAEADRMIAAARRTGKKLGVIYQHRLRRDVMAIRQLIDEGRLGAIYRRSLVDTPFKTQYYYDSGAWRGTWSGEGGGVLLNQAPHWLDLYQWLGGMPQRIFGVTRTLKHRIEVEDVATAIVEYADGGQGTIHCNTIQAPYQNAIELWGEGGGIVMQGGKVLFHRLEVPLQSFIDTDRSQIYAQPPAKLEELDASPQGPGHAGVVSDFASAVREGREPLVPGTEGIKSLEIANAIILSSYTGDWVELPVPRDAYESLLDDLRSGRRAHPRKVASL